MNLFLDATQVLAQNDGLNYINYDTISESNKEFLLSNMWDFQFTQPAAAVYFPGNALLKARTVALAPQFQTGLTQLNAIIRQFEVRQTVMSGTTSGTIGIEYMDREDQAIMAWLDDWRDKCGDREHRFMFRKEDTIAQGRLTIYNSTRVPIREYSLITMQIMDSGNGLNPQLDSGDANNVGGIQAQFSFEHFKLNWKNI